MMARCSPYRTEGNEERRARKQKRCLASFEIARKMVQFHKPRNTPSTRKIRSFNFGLLRAISRKCDLLPMNLSEKRPSLPSPLLQRRRGRAHRVRLGSWVESANCFRKFSPLPRAGVRGPFWGEESDFDIVMEICSPLSGSQPGTSRVQTTNSNDSARDLSGVNEPA